MSNNPAGRAEYLKSIDVFLQREDDFLLYTPDIGVAPEPPALRVEPSRFFACSGWYLLEGHRPVACGPADAQRLEEYLERGDRYVARTHVTPEVEVSTVFLGYALNWRRTGVPILFETIIFCSGDDEYQERYATWDEAEAGHARAVAVAQGKIEERSA